MIRRIMQLAVPNIISNITVPLVGMADLAIVGAMGSTDLLGGMAIGTAIFSLLYWNFVFLRMGSSGLAAQAYGRRDFAECGRVLVRAVIVSTSIAVLILIFQTPLLQGILWFMEGTPVVESAAADYFRWRVWAAPATLGLYAFQGWFIGMQNSKTPMWIALSVNGINVVASVGFAFWAGMGLVGVGLGTAIAQWCGLLIALCVVTTSYRRVFAGGSWRKGLTQAKALGGFFRLNRDIFLRSLCLGLVFAYFTRVSSSEGTVVLAANTLLLQLFTFFAYFMDGFSYAGEALVGRYTGSGNRRERFRAVQGLFAVGSVLAVLFGLFYGLAGSSILTLFGPEPAVSLAADDRMIYAALLPLVSFGAFLMDGILVGLTLSRIMRDVVFGATALFFVIYLLGGGLWVSFLVFLLVRSVGQFLLSLKIIRPTRGSE